MVGIKTKASLRECVQQSLRLSTPIADHSNQVIGQLTERCAGVNVPVRALPSKSGTPVKGRGHWQAGDEALHTVGSRRQVWLVCSSTQKSMKRHSLAIDAFTPISHAQRKKKLDETDWKAPHTPARPGCLCVDSVTPTQHVNVRFDAQQGL